jgi:DNA-directed RNA polymerase specialized sigma24 family protein
MLKVVQILSRETRNQLLRLFDHENLAESRVKEILHFTHKEIGDILGMEPNTVAQAYRRANAKWQHP